LSAETELVNRLQQCSYRFVIGGCLRMISTAFLYYLFFICQAILPFCNKLVTLVYKQETNNMYTTINEDGILNNYATEPEMYYSEYPSPEQQNRYAFQGAIAGVFVMALVLVALAAS
jgi:hypothetical protein